MVNYLNAYREHTLRSLKKKPTSDTNKESRTFLSSMLRLAQGSIQYNYDQLFQSGQEPICQFRKVGLLLYMPVLNSQTRSLTSISRSYKRRHPNYKRRDATEARV